MAFQKLPGNLGQIYVPECKRCKKKNPCPDCFNCQWCGNERCRVCLGADCAKKRKPKAKQDNPKNNPRQQ